MKSGHHLWLRILLYATAVSSCISPGHHKIIVFHYLCLANSWSIGGLLGGLVGWLPWFLCPWVTALSVTRKTELKYQGFFLIAFNTLSYTAGKKKTKDTSPWTIHFDIKYMNVHLKDKNCSSFIASVSVILKGYIYAGSEILFTGNTHMASLILKE